MRRELLILALALRLLAILSIALFSPATAQADVPLAREIVSTAISSAGHVVDFAAAPDGSIYVLVDARRNDPSATTFLPYLLKIDDAGILTAKISLARLHCGKEAALYDVPPFGVPRLFVQPSGDIALVHIGCGVLARFDPQGRLLGAADLQWGTPPELHGEVTYVAPLPDGSFVLGGGRPGGPSDGWVGKVDAHGAFKLSKVLGPGLLYSYLPGAGGSAYAFWSGAVGAVREGHRERGTFITQFDARGAETARAKTCCEGFGTLFASGLMILQEEHADRPLSLDIADFAGRIIYSRRWAFEARPQTFVPDGSGMLVSATKLLAPDRGFIAHLDAAGVEQWRTPEIWLQTFVRAASGDVIVLEIDPGGDSERGPWKIVRYRAP